jgi:hypothetical protein
MQLDPLTVGVALLVAGVFVGHYITVALMTKKFVLRFRGMAQWHAGRMNLLVNSCYQLVKDRMNERQFIMEVTAYAHKKYGVHLDMIPQDGARPPVTEESNVNSDRDGGEGRPGA